MLKHLGLLAAALAANAGAAEAPHTYIVRLQGAPLLQHARQRAEQAGAVRMFGEKAAVRRQLASVDSEEYLHQLDVSRAGVLAAGSAALGRQLQPRHVFRHAENGMALKLTAAEAEALAKLPGVAAVRQERRERLLTDAGPQWIGADELWNAQSGTKTKGEGVVIGIVDTGINPAHPSFAAQGPDGYAISNPRGHFYGLCATAEATCNNKLIGIYDFTDEGTQGVDSVGHGSHVSGIAAGNALTDGLQGNTVTLQRQVSGVAPHANIIMYKACVSKSASNPDGGCAESDLVAALDQATADGVDVINYSIGGDAQDPYALLDIGGNDASSMFQARAAGTVVVVAAGNEGPGPHSLDEPGNVPWVISVANSSHNRRFANSLGTFSGAANPPPTLNGQGYTAGYGPANIVYAGNFGNALCGTGDTEGTNPTGASNPFAAGTFHGEIVVCDRGTYARVEKGYNVLHAGAGGYVLANTVDDGESVVSDDHFLPAVHLGYSEGAQLKAWLNAAGSHMGKIAGVTAAMDNSYGDILEASSSRGPTGFGVLKPDLTAPGTNILSAARTGTGEALMTGTSMASPHVAGAAALLIAAHPNWSPSQVESALIGTALAGSVRKEDAVTLGTPLDAGAGRVQPATAAKAGLYLPLSTTDIRAQDPAHGGKPENLNRPGIESESCLGQCSFTRTVADMSGGGTWQVSATAPEFAHVTVTPNQFTLGAGATQNLNISVDVSDPHLAGTWISGRIVLHKSTGGQSAVDFALPVAVYSSTGAQPAFHEFTMSGPGDSKTIQLSGLAALPQADFVQAVQAPAQAEPTMNLGVDTKSDDLYANFPGTGKQFKLIPNVVGTADAASGIALIAEITANAPIANLYAGIDYNGDEQPEFAEQACAASSVAGSVARCVIDMRGAGPAKAWVLVDVPKSNPAGTYSVNLTWGLPLAFSSLPSQYSFGAVGPGHVPAGASFPVRVMWNRPLAIDKTQAPDAGTRNYGAVLIGTTSDQIASFVPFSVTRSVGGNDVADALGPGPTGRYFELAPAESSTHVFLDVPVSADWTLTTQIEGNNKDPIQFYVARADFPQTSASSAIAAAPPSTAALTQWTLDGTTAQKTMQISLSAGRWYLVAKSTSTKVSSFTVTSRSTPAAPVVHPSPGAYFNPDRSGHGIFISQGGGNQVVYWYTYDENGAPIWYQAFDVVPDATKTAWYATLYQITWDGTAVNTTTEVGDVSITPINATDFMYSWHLYGKSGSEHFTLLGADECVSLNGAQTNLSGQWYAPTQSGYGMDVLALSREQFDAFYLYDSLGQPVWAAGDAEPFTANTTLPVLQYSGFCPLCDYKAPTTTPIGTLQTSFASGLAGSYTAALNLAPPLTGSWNINQPTARLTGKTTCP